VWKRLDLVGEKFGRLVVKRLAKMHNRKAFWECVCDCGKKVIVSGSHLKSGHSESCGCLQSDIARQIHVTHGMKGTSEYNTWVRMRQRCENQTDKSYKNYGGRGIRVCERWHKFENFLEDMGPRPRGRSIDRIDNDGDYTPDNCRWAASSAQNNNRRDNNYIFFRGQKKTLSQWAFALGINYHSLSSRLHKLGWTVERAFTTPVCGKRLTFKEK
jgi:transcription elongation factor Elf1